MKAQTSVLNGIYFAFTLNNGFSLKDIVKCFNPEVSENPDKEFWKGIFMYHIAFYNIIIYEYEFFFCFYEF